MAAVKGQPSFHILISLIEIWNMKDPKKPMAEPESPLRITEVESIQIDDSYRKLIGTASVKFPRGTVIKKTITTLNEQENANKVSATVDDAGVLITTRTDSKVASVADFKVGQRIRIYLGYTEDPTIAALTKLDANKKSIFNDSDKLKKYKEKLKIMFEGYITKCSIDTPIEIQCENLASGLKKITCPKVTAKKNMTVNDFLAENGKYKLLKNSSLSLHPETKSCEINIGKVNLTSDLTVADVLTEWSKYKVFAFIKFNGDTPYIAVGRSYFSNPGKDSVLNYSDNKSDIPEILFDYHVANNGLTLMNTDKDFLAVEATGLDKDDKFYHITIRKNPDYNSSKKGSKKWQVMNETKLSKKAMKLGATPLTKSKDRVDLSKYTVIPYMSRKIGITKEALLQEAIKYFESYNMNGIEGQLTLFGDLNLKTAQKVQLTDKRHPAKNGYYLVDEISTTFGTDGYRQTIKLPYCIAKIKSEDKNDNKTT